MSRLRTLFLLPLLASLGSCSMVVMNPAGDVAAQQRDLLMVSTALMLIVIIPVMALTIFFAWRYRQSNREARYEPDWDHSTHLELVIWAVPLLIIICLGAVTWMGTHLLDPYRPIGRVSAGKPLPPDVRPLEVEVVALDWKWLFIYPQYGVAMVNELAAPVDRPISFRITSASVMNSFYIPALAGQIYAMPGMETRLHAVINKSGDYEGFSANYSGAGFSGMRFAFHGLDDAGFQAWIAKAKDGGGKLDRNGYLELEQPSENQPVRHYAAVDADLYKAILNMCVEPGKMCMSEMSQIDAKGGLGMAGIRNTLPLLYDKFARRGTIFGPAPSYVASICTTEEALAASKADQSVTPMTSTPIVGVGLQRPPPLSIRLPSPSATGTLRSPFNS
ncbi:ubiquinol oxidase subunit II [Mesorhizobium sp. M7A.F.Ca.US.011.01.1.1]|uniref:ubiquinol oxidase subunit II n=1 Tax=Mesorhizobium sp. M7A.F.Ca.US.011.01.1.1 TaxID=2496741 RepID=UPI000FCA28AE|nr:ubiquinol oxidase subunit II [Mesorhizobium sp. M7A.F.Ca.US.011.01.1.1]RUX28170.1 ubiquinol oxidase subunit II [Mesorhizobium sp. M7A.F.Ca.US.011.01.1.1]